ncbi:MAG: lysylphosphatidylglycerol synthase transmembrane domain-containing protein [Alphaproteobacteria bacterium]
MITKSTPSAETADGVGATAPGGLSARARWAVALAATAGFGLLLAYAADWTAVLDALAATPIENALAGLAGAWAMILARGLRLAILLRRPDPWPLRLAILHNFFGLILPLRLGELSLLWYLKREGGQSYATSAGYLMLLRLFDLFCLALVISAAAWWVLDPADGAGLRWWGPALTAVLALSILALPVIFRLIAGYLRRSRIRLLDRWRGHLADTATVLAGLGHGHLALILATTVLLWAVLIGVCAIAVDAILPAAGPAVALAAFAGMALTYLLPATGIANLGTFEAGWVAGMTLAGVAVEPALASGILAHAFFMAGTVSMAPLASLLRRRPA